MAELTIFTLLDRPGLFHGMSAQSREELAGISIAKKLSKGQHLFSENDKGYALFLLADGVVRLYKSAPDGREVVIKDLGPGEFFGEVILFEKDHYPVSAVAMKAGKVYLLPAHQFHCLLERPHFRSDFIKILMQKQRYLVDKIRYITHNSVQERLVLFLREQYGERSRITLAMSKKEVAAAIGTTPETLSRVLLQFRNEGLLRSEGKVLLVDGRFWKAGEGKTV